MLGGLFGAAGKDLYETIKDFFQTKTTPATRASIRFQDKDYPAGSCRWVREDKLSTLLADGYTYYINSATDSRMYRVVTVASGQEIVEHLLVQPNARKFTEAD